MANNLYVAAAEPYSGKIIISLGLMGLLERTIGRIGFFRPVARAYRPLGAQQPLADRDAWLLREVFQLEVTVEQMCAVSFEQAEQMLAAGAERALFERIVDAYKRLEAEVDFVLCEGTDYLSLTSAVESGFNVEVARDLNAPVLLVVDGESGDPAQMHAKACIALDQFRDKGCEVLAVLFNKVPPAALDAAGAALRAQLGAGGGAPYIGLIPHEPTLAMPSMEEVTAHLGGRVLFGHEHLHKKVARTIVASGSVQTMIPLLDNDSLMVTHTDRHDAILLAMVSLMSRTAPNIGGVVLSGERELAEPMQRLLEGLPGPRFPIVRSPVNTYETVLALSRLRTRLEPRYARELTVARQLFDSHIDVDALARAIQLSAPNQLTPTLFKHGLVSRARAERQHIVLPEGEVERILVAADALLRLQAVDLTLLGDPAAVRTRAGQLGLDIAAAQIVDPQRSEWHAEFAALYQQVRAKKGMTIERARDAVIEPPLFGTLMVHTGRADGMVAGATTSTAATIRPAFQVIRTRRGSSLVSSVFFMCLADRVLVYGDCAVNPDPSAEQLAEIAVTSADTAQAFGIAPRVAMLSYSTGESGQGADVEKVRTATRLARALRPELLIEGPLQYDAAVDAVVAQTKLPPGSTVAGRATVLIFPDLNTGNNTYKAVQRSAGAVAIGPVLQGLNKPVNDLSRGCTVEDIVNTVAITAIQAQRARG